MTRNSEPRSLLVVNFSGSDLPIVDFLSCYFIMESNEETFDEVVDDEPSSGCETNSDFEEVEEDTGVITNRDSCAILDVTGPYSDEPIASPEWVNDYKKKQKERETEQEELQKRMDGKIPVSSWYDLAIFSFSPC